jgi:hypothetical protein
MVRKKSKGYKRGSQRLGKEPRPKQKTLPEVTKQIFEGDATTCPAQEVRLLD